jgi:hypothetical protein
MATAGFGKWPGVKAYCQMAMAVTVITLTTLYRTSKENAAA